MPPRTLAIKGVGKAKAKGVGKAKDRGYLTHSELNTSLQKHGALIGELMEKLKSPIDPYKNAMSSKIDIIKLYKDRTLLTSKKFGVYYRNLQDKQDEFVSTSSVRELIIGALSSLRNKKMISASEAKPLNEFFQSLSDVRYPTRWSGFANSTDTKGPERMQHPTSTTTGGIWRETLESKDGNPHSELDRQRKEEILKELQQGIAKGHSILTIGKAMLIRSITFTLNEFTAPATASDQHPLAKIDQKERYDQVSARESLKEYAVKLGAIQESETQEPGRHSLRTRRWGNRRGRRSLSPPRKY